MAILASYILNYWMELIIVSDYDTSDSKLSDSLQWLCLQLHL